MDTQLDRQIHRYMDRSIDLNITFVFYLASEDGVLLHAGRRVGRQLLLLCRQMDRWIDRQIDRYIYIYIFADRQIDRQIDIWIDTQLGRCICRWIETYFMYFTWPRKMACCSMPAGGLAANSCCVLSKVKRLTLSGSSLTGSPVDRNRCGGGRGGGTRFIYASLFRSLSLSLSLSLCIHHSLSIYIHP